MTSARIRVAATMALDDVRAGRELLVESDCVECEERRLEVDRRLLSAIALLEGAVRELECESSSVGG